MVKGLTIGHRGDVIERVEKRSTTLELLAVSGSLEVTRQHVEAGRHFYLYAADDWSGFELLYILEGELTVDDEVSEPVVLRPGDFVYHNGLPERVYFRVGPDTEFLMVSSSPSFHMMRDGVEDIAEMARTVEEKDSATEGHCWRLDRLAVLTGEKLGLSGEELIDLSYGAYLHDVGKVRVPDEILGKEASLTDEEWEQMKRHPDHGAEILGEREFLGRAAEIVRAHHERYDGTGYPNGLKGHAIPIGARIIAVVDTYDAITSARPYQPALAKSEAIEELKAHAGTQFDPRVVRAFLLVIENEEDEADGGAD